jgi:2-dehydropantoate 2-reductase
MAEIESRSAEPDAGLKIAIIGAGAMGGYFAGRIKECGGSVVLVDVNQDRLDAIARDGLRIEDDSGDRRIAIATARASDLAEPVDLVIVFTKGMHTKAAVESVRHVVAGHTWFLTLQNGLGNPEQIAESFPGHQVAMGATDVPADVAGPSHVRSHGHGAIRLWSLSGEASSRLERIRSLLETAGIPSTADPDIRVAVWEKASFNAAMNGLCALARVPVGSLDNQDGRALIQDIVTEAVATAAAIGICLDQSRILSKIDFALANHRGHHPSMLQDLLAGRETEIETINGAIARIAEQHQIPAPINRTLTRLVRLAQSPRSAA